MSTPPHIVPEWYFLPIYAILRSIPDKSGGVAAIALVFICLLALPFFKSMYVRSSSFRPIYQGIFWLLLADCLLLGWIGCQPVEAPFVTIGQISSLVFFLFFAITPILGRVGRGIPNSYTDETDQWTTLTPRIYVLHQEFIDKRLTKPPKAPAYMEKETLIKYQKERRLSRYTNNKAKLVRSNKHKAKEFLNKFSKIKVNIEFIISVVIFYISEKQ